MFSVSNDLLVECKLVI